MAKIIKLIRANQFGAVALYYPIDAINDGVLIGATETFAGHVPKHTLQKVRRCNALLEVASFYHPISDIFDDPYSWLKPAVRHLMFSCTICSMLFGIVNYLLSLSVPETDTDIVSAVEVALELRVASQFHASEHITVPTVGIARHEYGFSTRVDIGAETLDELARDFCLEIREAISASTARCLVSGPVFNTQIPKFAVVNAFQHNYDIDVTIGVYVGIVAV
jgi:hypothetical protein